MSHSLLTKIIRGCQCFRSNPARSLYLKSSFPNTNRDSLRRAYSSLHTQQPLPHDGISSNVAAYFIISSLLGTLAFQSFRRPLNSDAPPGSELASSDAEGAKIIITQADGQDQVDQVDTGTTTVPFFPRKIWLPRPEGVNDGRSRALPAGLGVVDTEEEYQLLGLGIRTVSFFSVEVYVVGLYVARSDLGKLQESMVRAITAPGATTLVEGEKEELKRTLLNSEGSEKIWDAILKREGIKSATRIVPTRGTAFGHLRDGWLRGITARGKAEQYSDDPGFQEALGEFK
ncbi:Altered inheritance of mitochondria protein 18 mitochondrial, partial [Sticta canariensis]|nr:Altered inheritance of mitochondria protein 18 mitochondrial [Sticta canariensis]